jgi:glycosyltransferase involved in cell wall biosynthesis
MRPDVEHWVIDGSDNDRIREYLENRPSTEYEIRWVCEPDGGIYDAMNKGLERAGGAFVLFINAGDIVSHLLDRETLYARLECRESCVLLGNTVEKWGNDRWLRPGLGRERDVFIAPAHQATFYPQAFYAANRYRLDLLVTADSNYTSRAIAHCGARYLPLVICEFALGGLSSRYDDLRKLSLRFRQTASLSSRVKIVAKAMLWRLLPRTLFYRLLAFGKYTRLRADRPVAMLANAAIFVPPMQT